MDVRSESLSGNQLHHQVVRSINAPRIKRGHDIGMHQLRRRANLGKELLNKARIGCQSAIKDLDRDFAVHRPMLGAINQAHPAFADLFEQKVFTQETYGTGLRLLGEFKVGRHFARIVRAEPRCIIVGTSRFRLTQRRGHYAVQI